MNFETSPPEHKLTLTEILDWMVNDKLISHRHADKVQQYSISWENREKELLEIIYDYFSAHPVKSLQTNSLESLYEWAAAKVNLPFYYIDPLKINVSEVTTICAQPYAERYNILPVKIEKDCITIAVSEPFIREWEKDLKHIHKKEFKRVFASSRDIKRYIGELFDFSNSVKIASNKPIDQIGQLTIWNNWSNWENPVIWKSITSISLTWLTGSCNMLLTKEPVIFTWNRAGIKAKSAFA